MACGKCGPRTKLCPLSFGLALGITAAIMMFLWSLYVMYYGMPGTVATTTPAMITVTWGDVGMHTLYAFIKGLVFGFILAGLYDLIACACKCRRCKGGNGNCNCNCGCCTSATCNCPCTCCSGNKK